MCYGGIGVLSNCVLEHMDLKKGDGRRGGGEEIFGDIQSEGTILMPRWS